MPINLERPLINSNLDSYLGEAGTGAGLDVPGMPMRQPGLSTGRSSGSFTSAQLGSVSLRGMNKVTRGRSSENRLLS